MSAVSERGPGSGPRRPRRALVALTLAGVLAPAGVLAVTGVEVSAQAATAVAPVDRVALVAALDSAARAHVEHPLVAGASVAVVRGEDVLLRRGYGFVDLEWDVPTPPDADASYEIGSVTKQFTAAALLTLVEEGLVDLDADVTEYLDFDTRGRRVPVRRLLDHTSGIRGYTEMPVFGEIAVRKLPRDTLVRLVESEPFDFEPGTAQIYNNSAYFLLGLIIEKVTGRAYEDVIADRLFGPAGMTGSYYCSESATRDRRAHGYDAAGAETLNRAAYLDHTWPYAAGSLCSTVDDLVKWNRALHGGRLVEPASYAAMTTPRPLADGTPIRYAMGIGVDDGGGRRVIAHSGGINGFLSYLAYYPAEDLTVVVLQNTAGPRGPGTLAGALADLVLGPVPPPPPRAFDGDLRPLMGTYRGPARGQPMEVEVLVEDGALALRIGGQDPTRPAYRGDLRWDVGGTRFIFVRTASGVSELRVDSGGGHYVLARVGG